MDPLSIASACVALAASIGKVSVQINDFCRQVRDARRDLDLVTRELGSLKTTLDILADDIKDPDHAFPSYLGKQIFDLVANCNDVVEQVRQLLNKYEGGGLRNGTRWALSGREDMNKLRVSLEAHKSALELALEVITLTITRDIKNDTTNLRGDTGQIIDQTNAIKTDTEQILTRIELLRLQLPDSGSLNGNIHKLQDYLDSLTSYADSGYGISEPPPIPNTNLKIRDTAKQIENADLANAQHVDTSTSWTALSGAESVQRAVRWKARPQVLKCHSQSIHTVMFLHNGKIIASISKDDTVKLWDVKSGTLLQTLEAGAYPHQTFSPEGKILACATYSKTIKLWDVDSKTLLRTLKHPSHISAVEFSHDGRILASGLEDKTIKLWDFSSGTLRQTLKAHSNWVTRLAFSPDGTILASSAIAEKVIKLWNVNSGTLLQTFESPSSYITCIRFSLDCNILASASHDKSVKLWSVTSGALLHTLSGHSYDVYFITFSSDGKRLASASMDNAQVWNVSSGARLQQMQTMETHVGVFNFAQRTLINLVGVAVSRALTSDLHLLASSVNSKAIKLWDARSGAMLQTLEGHSDSVSDMAFSPDNKLLASASVDGTIRLWDAGS